MEQLSINILKPIAKSILNNLEDLKIIEINKDDDEFFKLIKTIRSQNIDITLNDIVEEVDKVRELRYNESNIWYKYLDIFYYFKLVKIYW